MFAFQLPFGSLNEAAQDVRRRRSPPSEARRGDESPRTVASIAKSGGPVGLAAAFDAELNDGPGSEARPVGHGDPEHGRLAALFAAALREVDCGVVVCNSAERAPSFLVLGRRRAAEDAACAPPRDGSAAVPSLWPPCEGDRSLLTLLFTDIVASTEMVERLGDDAWQALLDRHRTIVRAQLAAFRGVEIDNAGDGFFATFDAPARAVRCARAIEDALAAIGVSVRAGIHTGECARVGGRISGVAVHVAARIVEVAGPGEVLVSATVRDLVAGSGLEFRDRDWHALRGLSGERQLFALHREGGK